MSLDAAKTDVLAQYRLKPWWEDIRSYALGLMLASSLVLSYNFETVGAVDCRPFNSTSSSIESADTTFVNSVCVKDFSSTLYTGTLNVVGAGVLLLLNNWWLQRRRVRRAFASIRKADDMLQRVKFTLSEEIGIATQPLKMSSSGELEGVFSRLKKQVQGVFTVRDAGRKIFLRDTGSFSRGETSLNTFYLAGNFVSMFVTFGLLATTYLFGLRIEAQVFTCQDTSAFSGLDTDKYACAQSVSSQLTSFVVLYYFLGLAQVLVAFGAFIGAYARYESTRRMTTIQKTILDNRFILNFSRQSNELEESTQILMSLTYKELRDKVKKAAAVNGTVDDEYFNELLWALDLV